MFGGRSYKHERGVSYILTQPCVYFLNTHARLGASEAGFLDAIWRLWADKANVR